MNDEVEVRPVSVMRRNSKKYNKLLKSQAIRAHLNGAKFADVSKQFGPCEDTVRKWLGAYFAGLLTLPGLEPVTPRTLAKPARVHGEESFVSLIGQHDSGQIVPLPKAGKDLHIPLNEMAILKVRASIALEQSQNQRCIESPYLYPNPSTGEPFQQIFYSWDKARKAAHIDEVRMHDLRHSFASAMVNSGMTLYDVKEILGHSNIRTTERYAHLSNSRLRQAAESVTTYYDQQDWLGLP